MKRIILASVVALTLSACQSGKITPAETALTACQTYTAALNTAAKLNTAGQLSAKAEAAVDKSVAIADPLCAGSAPKFDGSALDTVSVQAAVAMINAAIGE
jgi:hypothetical protein